MHHSHGVIGLALVVFAGAAFAESDASSPAVEKLKSSLASTSGFQVENEREGNSGASCITYRVSSSNGGSTKAHAVVQGDKVLRSTSRSKDFEEAWNTNCTSGRSSG